MDEMIRLGLTLMVVTLVASLALALTNHYTIDMIEMQQEKAVKESLNYVIDADSFKEMDGFYAAYKDDKLTGMVWKIEVPGYSSIINALVGVKPGNKLSGVEIVSQQETPGLGANIEQRWFLDQFKDKKEEELKFRKDGGEIDGITGATISSRALVNGVRNRLNGESISDALTSASPQRFAKKGETDSVTKAEINGTG